MIIFHVWNPQDGEMKVFRPNAWSLSRSHKRTLLIVIPKSKRISFASLSHPMKAASQRTLKGLKGSGRSSDADTVPSPGTVNFPISELAVHRCAACHTRYHIRFRLYLAFNGLIGWFDGASAESPGGESRTQRVTPSTP